VNAPGPPEKKPLLGGEGLRKLITTAPYHALDLLQARAHVSLRRLWPERFTNVFEQDGGRA